MNDSLFIIADRGKLKAFRAEKARTGRAYRLDLVEAITLAEAHLSVRERFTDEAGSFPTQTGAGSRQTVQGNSIAERHYDIEDDRRSAKQLAKHINEILHREKPSGWSFAAPAEIQPAVLSEVEPGLREQLLERLPQDLVNVPANQLLEHFSTVA
jgi:Protein required for attachment to host cells